MSLLATIGGVLLIYAGVAALLRLDRPPARARRRRAGAPAPGGLAVAALAAALIGGAVAAFLVGGGASVAAPAVTGCNGHGELCDRPLDEVVLAATHNSMSRRARLVLLPAGRADRRPARRRRPRAADRHPLRRPAAERARADRARGQPRAAGAGRTA